MIYITGKITSKGYWGHFTRMYARAIQLTGLDIWARWADDKPAQEETTDPSFRSVLAMGSAMGPDGELRQPQPAHAVVHIGPVTEVLTQYMKDTGPYNVALTSWFTDSVPKRMTRRLNQFDEVWVPTYSEAQVLREAGVKNAKHVAPPLGDLKVHRAKPSEKSKEFLFYSIGYWEGWDNCKAALDTYLMEFRASDKVRLLLMCPDAPVETQEDLEEYARSLGCFLDTPRVSIVRRLPRSWAELVDVHAMGSSYVLTANYWADHLDANMADTCGSLIVSGSVPEEVPRDQAKAPFTPPQKWAVTDNIVLASAMREVFEDQQGLFRKRPPKRVVGHGTVDTLRVIMVGWDESLAPEPPKVVAANPNAKHLPSLAVIVPHRNRGAAAIEATLASITGQLNMMDELIVSDQGSDPDVFEEIKELCSRYGATLVADWAYDGEWSIARARNAGLAVAEDTAEWVWCLDGDIVLPTGFVDALKQRAMEHGDEGIAPRVVELPGPVDPDDVRGGMEVSLVKSTLGERIGSGVSAFPATILVEENGWDEWFAGYGSEDIDLLFRLRHKRNFEVKHWDDGPPLYHQPHEVQHVGGSVNLERSMARDRGELGWEASHGNNWGAGAELVLRRGRDEEEY